MTQDTRKDRRVKIVSLNVRYKSATVDEFIENHALDVSRGGIYIKTGSPFPPGTLLKFEVRLASDQALITGVGRVVWKRDAGQGTGDRPAGMGVKFIKVDDPSKAVIDKLVNTRTDAGRSYEAESETPSPEAQTPVAASAARTPTPAPVGNRPIGKSTMLGMGAVSAAATGSRSSARPGTPSSAPRPSGGGMFPKTNSEAEMPPKQEQTVMKQAAELLEEALREAGGTMEDVGNNPLFAGSPVPAAGEPAPAPAAVEAAPEAKAASLAPGEGPASAAEAARARAMVAGMAPASVIPQKAPSDPPRTTRDAPISKTAERKSLPSGRVSVRPAPGRAASMSSAPPKPPKKGGSGVLILLGVAAAAGVVGVVYRDTLFGSTAPAVPAAPPSVQAAATAPPLPVPSQAPSALEAPAPAATHSAAAMASAAPSAAPSASASAGPHASASAGAPPAPVAVHAPHPVYAPKPVAPAPAGPATATAAATATATPDSTSTAAPAATAAPTAAATSAPASTSTASPTASPAATAKPKGPKPADDNPY
jgi:uncharacterized protein (TIGR02266 family)